VKSKISEALGMKDIRTVALSWTDVKPQAVLEYKPGKWGCVMWLITAAARGKVAVASRETVGCYGGGVGLGFGNAYENFPGGVEGFCYFLSIGNEARAGGKELAEKVRPYLTAESYDHFLHGERYVKSPALVEKFIEELPMRDIPARYVVFKPLDQVRPEDEAPKTVIFFVNPDQLSALVILANYAREGNENVIIPYAAGCQTVGIYPYREGEKEKPRAVVGLTDISARLYTKKQLGSGQLMTFAVPWPMFLEMEGHVEGSFLERPTWKGLTSSDAG